MREVGVHLEHQAGVVLERIAEAGEVGGTDAVLLGPVQYTHVVVFARQPVGYPAGAVGRAVVDDENAKPLGRCARQHLAGGGGDRLDVLRLVVCRQDQPGSSGHPSAYPRAVDLSNGEIADALEELGDLYELDGAIAYRVLAYRTAARAVREASVSVAALAAKGAPPSWRASARPCRKRSRR